VDTYGYWLILVEVWLPVASCRLPVWRLLASRARFAWLDASRARFAWLGASRARFAWLGASLARFAWLGRFACSLGSVRTLRVSSLWRFAEEVQFCRDLGSWLRRRLWARDRVLSTAFSEMLRRWAISRLVRSAESFKSRHSCSRGGKVAMTWRR
jgi:hypothetical protein